MSKQTAQVSSVHGVALEVALEEYHTEQLGIPKRRNIEQGVGRYIAYTQRGGFNILGYPYYCANFDDDFCTCHR